MFRMLLRSRRYAGQFSNDVLGTLAPPRRSQILMVRGIEAQLDAEEAAAMEGDD